MTRLLRESSNQNGYCCNVDVVLNAVFRWNQRKLKALKPVQNATTGTPILDLFPSCPARVQGFFYKKATLAGWREEIRFMASHAVRR